VVAPPRQRLREGQHSGRSCGLRLHPKRRDEGNSHDFGFWILDFGFWIRNLSLKSEI
jgi:hypothetical protein